MTGGRLCLMLVFCSLSGACGGKSSELARVGREGADAGAGTASGGASAAGVGGAADGAEELAPCEGGATFTYALRSIVTNRVTTSADGARTLEVFGFDLDGRDSDGTQPEDCGAVDTISSDGHRGIDNTIAGLWAEDFAPGAERALADSSLVSTIRLSGVDSFEDDTCVDITWSDDLPQFRRAKIEAGRLLADGNGTVRILGLAQPRSSVMTLVFPLSSPRIAFRASPDALIGGSVGGSMTREQLVRSYEMLLGEVSAHAIADLTGSSIIHPDLPANGLPCVLLSAGFAFEATVNPPQGG